MALFKVLEKLEVLRMSITNVDWVIRRKPSAYKDWYTLYAGSETVARRKYEKIALNLRQGAVVLFDAEGREVAKESGPMVRTRW